jgi:hypothetical protein
MSAAWRTRSLPLTPSRQETAPDILGAVSVYPRRAGLEDPALTPDESRLKTGWR